MNKRVCLAISGLAKGLVEPYGGRLVRFTIHEDKAIAREPSALERFLQRQHCLKTLYVSNPSSILSVIAVLAGSGAGTKLDYLELYCSSTGALATLSADDARGVAALAEPLALMPALKTLHIYVEGEGTSRLQLEIWLGAVARGAAPKLRTLGL